MHGLRHMTYFQILQFLCISG